MPVSRLANRTLFVIMLLLLTLAILLTWRYINERNRLEQVAFASAEQQANDAARQIERAFGRVMAIASGIANDLTVGSLPYPEIEARLRETVAENSDIDGLAITFAPFIYDSDLRLYQMYIYKIEDGSFDILEGATYDYTAEPNGDPNAPNTDWFRIPLESGPTWTEPFFAAGAQKILIEYGVPFYRINEQNGTREPAGVVTIDYSLVDTRSLIGGLDLGTTGYSFLMASSGTFLAHPQPDLVATSTIFVLADATSDEALREIGQRALAGEAFATSIHDPLTRQPAWVFIEPIVTTDWSLAIILNQSEFLPNVRDTVREQITILLVAAGALLFWLLRAFQVVSGARDSLWGASISFSLISVLLIIAVWLMSIGLRDHPGTMVTDQRVVDTILQTYRLNLQTSETLYEIPTGVIVQAVDYRDATSVTINGYIWQRYPVDIDTDILQGFNLPQRTGEEVTLDEIERIRQNGEEVIVWYIGVTLKQQFDPTPYPFDRRDIEMRIAPADLSGRVVLVPDLTAYSIITPENLPGLDSDVHINNWQQVRSYYSYQTQTPVASFGLLNRVERSLPELHFNLDTQRQFLGPFLAYLLPATVIALMMFAYLLNDRDPDNTDEVTNALNYAAALFFVLAVSHAALRDSIAAVDLTYLEYLYILLYAAIVLVSADIFLLVKRPRLRLIRLRNNLIPKLIYWPALTGIMLIVTLMIFVYG